MEFLKLHVVQNAINEVLSHLQKSMQKSNDQLCLALADA